MTLASHVIRSVTTADHHYDYLRTIGRNAFLGSHGNGGKQTVYIVETDRGATGWGLPLYENAYEKGDDGIWRISRLSGPFTMYTSWEGWGKNALNNTWPDKFEPPPDLPPSTVYLTYPAYYIVPFHYPNPVTGHAFAPDTGQVGAYFRPPGTPEQAQSLQVGRLADGTQPIAEPPKD